MKITIKRIQKSWFVYKNGKMLAQEFDTCIDGVEFATKVFPNEKVYVDNTPNVRLLESLRII